MAIYTESAVQYNGVQRESIEDMINDDRVVPSESDDFVSEGMEIILGMTENYNMVMEHVGRSELLALEQTGEQLVYTEGVISGIFGTIKKFLMKIWEKIKSLFKRFIMMIDSYTKNDKAFINKYRQQIYRHKSLSDFTFKGYKYTIDTGKISNMFENLSKVSTDMKKIASKNPGFNDTGNHVDPDQIQKEIIDKLDDIVEEQRGELLSVYPGGKKGKYTSEEFRKEFKELLRNGEDEKQELDEKDIDVDEMVTELQNYRQTKKIIDTAFRDNKKIIDNDNKEVDRLSKEHSKSDDWKDDTNKSVKDITGTVSFTATARGNQDLEQHIKQWGLSVTPDGFNQFKTLLDEAERNPGKDIDGTVEAKTKSGNTIKIDVTVTGKDNQVVVNITPREMHKRQGKFIQLAFRVINETKQILVDIDTIVLQALKERSRQYKACLVKIVYHNPKNEESYNESYSYGNNGSYISPLSSVEFK